ncbi:signal peptide peptidase SppA [Candidatus Woesearchaeota archaeon]|nr:signal peptide peptidase SppA [Candidatus Woesearchaeota archaeon]
MKKEETKKPWGLIIFVLVILFLLSMLFAGIISVSTELDVELLAGNVALIPVKGVIRADGAGSWGEQTASSTDIVDFIEKANKNPNIKAIILDINSPGGSAVASEEIANAVKEANKTTVALIREVGASGAYWIASAADKIVANRMSVTGSIGVFSSYLEFAGFLSDHNVTYQRLVSGKYKDTGSPFKELTEEERGLLQNKLDRIHIYFIERVAENRGLSTEQVESLATGMYYLGIEAKELGLIDVLGGREEAIELIEKELNITAELAKYERKKTWLDVLGEVISQGSFHLGRGISSGLFKTETDNLAVWA